MYILPSKKSLLLFCLIILLFIFVFDSPTISNLPSTDLRVGLLLIGTILAIYTSQTSFVKLKNSTLEVRYWTRDLPGWNWGIATLRRFSWPPLKHTLYPYHIFSFGQLLKINPSHIGKISLSSPVGGVYFMRRMLFISDSRNPNDVFGIHVGYLFNKEAAQIISELIKINPRISLDDGCRKLLNHSSK